MSKLKMPILLTVFLVVSSLIQASYAGSDSEKATDQKEQRTPLVYKGWAAFNKQVLDPSAPDDEWLSLRDIKITDDGKKLRVMDDAKPTPYSLELIVITYERTNTTVLKLALYEDGKDKSITYIWGEPGAERLGMNLRWMQVGFTKTP